MGNSSNTKKIGPQGTWIPWESLGHSIRFKKEKKNNKTAKALKKSVRECRIWWWVKEAMIIKCWLCVVYRNRGWDSFPLC